MSFNLDYTLDTTKSQALSLSGDRHESNSSINPIIAVDDYDQSIGVIRRDEA